MSITHWPSTHYGLLVTKTGLMPLFTRAAVRNGADVGALSDEEKETCLSMPLEDFAKLADGGKLSEAFWDPENLESFEDELNIVGELEGVFTVLPEAVPAGAVMEPEIEGYAPGVRAVFEYEDAISLALERQQNLLAPAYPNYAAIEAEILPKLGRMGVELPEGFPLWKCVGRIAGVVYDN